jgi:hypothetical protein
VQTLANDLKSGKATAFGDMNGSIVGSIMQRSQARIDEITKSIR